MIRLRRALFTAGLALFLTALACNAGGRGQPTSTPRTVIIRQVEGTVTVQANADAEPNPASAGVVITQGMRLQTGADGRALLELDDLTAIVIAENATFTIDELSGTSQTPVSRFFLATGQIFAFKGEPLPQGAAFEIRAPQGNAAIRGSSMGVESQTNLTVGCLEGSCSGGNPAGAESLLIGGQKIQIDEFGNLGSIEPLSEEDLAAAQAALDFAHSSGLVPNVNLGNGPDDGSPPDGVDTPTPTFTLEPDAPTPTPTDTLQPLPNLPTTGGCVTATIGYEVVNIRNKPSLQADVVGVMSPFDTYQVIGRNAASDWYQIQPGWVSAGVTRRAGACNAVPDTYSTPTPTPTSTPTATATAQVAGDNEYPGVAVPYDGDPVSVGGAISYPAGDSQDTVTYRWANVPTARLIPQGTEFRYSIVCSGQGVEYAVIEFDDGSTADCTEKAYNFVQYVGPNTPSIGTFTIRLEGGDGAYVEWGATFSWYFP